MWFSLRRVSAGNALGYVVSQHTDAGTIDITYNTILGNCDDYRSASTAALAKEPAPPV